MSLKMVAFNLMARSVGQETYKRGLTYRLERRVLSTQLMGDWLEARVRGSGKTDYRVEVNMRGFRVTPPQFTSECTCPVQYNCKHAVAAVIEYFSSIEGEGSEGVSSDETKGPEAQELPLSARQWIEDLARLERPDTYPDTINQRVVYILSSYGGSVRTPELRVSIKSARLNKSGVFSTRLERANFDRAANWRRPAYILDSDVKLYEALNQATHSHTYAYSPLNLRVADFSLLQRLVDTGRLYWEELGPVFAMGAPRSGRVDWELSASDRHLHPRLLVDQATAFDTEPPVYVDVENALVGRIELPLNPAQSRAFLRAPAVRPEHAPLVSQALQKAFPEAVALAPKALLPPLESHNPPNARFSFTTAKVKPRGWSPSPGPNIIPVLEVSFRYGEISRLWRSLKFDPAGTLEVVKDARFIRATRFKEIEKDVIDALEATGAELAPILYPELSSTFDGHYSFETPDDWLWFIEHDLPRLRAMGIEIHFDDDFPYQLATSRGELSFDLNEGSGIDWLELHAGIDVDGEKVDLAPLLADLIKNPMFQIEDLKALADGDEPIYFRNAAGRYFSVAVARLLPLLLSLHELRLGAFELTKNGKLRLAKAAQIFLDFGSDSASSQRDKEALRSAYRALVEPATLRPVTLPDTFKATLRPYQETGVAWLNALRETGLGGILADDMGLGKTVQVLAFLAKEKADGRIEKPALIIMPTSLVGNWTAEAARFAPGLKLTVLQGKSRQDLLEQVPESDVVITTYPLVVRDHEWLKSNPWFAIILDEAQAIKNANAATTRYIRSLEASHRFCLSGTPMENHLGELWSLMDFVNPGFLGDATRFAREFRTPIEKTRNEEIKRLLVRRVRPFLLRRTKADVAKELPPKSEIIERITLTGKQRDLYDTIRLSLHKQVRKAIAERGLAKSHIIVLDALLKLRQVCCDPSLLKIEGTQDASSAKLDRLMEMVTALVEEGRRLIIFSQFTSMLDLIAARLDKAGLGYGILTGKTQNRKKEVDAFQSGDSPIFLISLKAGGTGLNLTSADTVILYDPWWNPAVEAQAIDRAYRIGQDKPVFVYRLCAEGTIEDKMDEMKARKQALSDALFDEDADMVERLTDADIEALFA